MLKDKIEKKIKRQKTTRANSGSLAKPGSGY
jgi:hypothetical protein